MEGNKFLAQYTIFLNRIANDALPPNVSQYFAESVLLSLSKDRNDLKQIRPIALGDHFMKLVSKLILIKFFLQIDELMGNVQQGVGRKFAIERIIHLLNFAMQSDEEWDTILVDYINAFNNVSRNKMLTAVLERFPQMQYSCSSLVPQFK